jgi:hypothetical protein
MDRTSRASLCRWIRQLTSGSTQGRNHREAGRRFERVTNAAWHAAAGGAGDHGRRDWAVRHRGCVVSASDARGANETLRCGLARWGSLAARIRNLVRVGIAASLVAGSGQSSPAGVV